MTFNEERLGEFMGTMVGYMTGGALCFSVWLGDELGLYRAMAGAGALSADDVAKRADCNARLVREWLDGQVAGGLIGYEAGNDSYELSPEAAMALADDASPVFVARGMNAFASMFMDIDKIKDAYRGDGGMSWGDHHPCLFSGTEWFFRTGYRASLATEWIPALDGVDEKLAAARRSPTSGAVTARRSSSWPTRTRSRSSGASTSTPRRSRRRTNGRPRRA